MKVAVISTLYNEESNVKELLDSIANQILKPDEIIIVDGGSTDNTIRILKEYKKTKLKNLKIIVKKGANIAQGRNIAIKYAKGELIATIDGGCIADKDWLKNLVEIHKKHNADVVAGVFKPLSKNLFEFVEGELICPDISKLPDDWPPSSRSALFTKEAWERVGGYPENLYTAEDTMFNFKLKKAGFKYKVARKALVYWRMRPNMKKLFKQYYLYGKGDGQVRLPFRIKEMKNFNSIKSLIVLTGFYLFIILLIISIFYKFYLLSLALLVLLFLYLLSPSFKIFKKRKDIRIFFYVPAINFIRRFAYFMGFHVGFFKGVKV